MKALRNPLTSLVLSSALLTVRHPGVEVSAEVAHGHEALAAAREAEEVVAALPVLHGLAHHRVGELDQSEVSSEVT